MTVLQVDQVCFGFGADTLFEDVTFSLEAGERLALVAPNGQGKSTLLKILAGEITPDEGRVLTPKGTRIVYLHQSHEPDPAGTVMDAMLSRFAEARAARAELTDAEHAAADGTAESLERLARAQDRHHATGADTIEHEAAAIAQRVGFGAADMDRPVRTLSGGERGRLQLAAVLASRPDLLLLDEPTNHLDVETVEWLEGFVQGLRCAVIIVSHDRKFLDATCNRTAELGLFRFRLYPVRYSQYLVDREADIERERAAVLAQRAEIAKTEDFIRRNIAGQKTKQAQARRRMLEKIERLDNPEDIWADARRLALRFAPARRSGDIVLDAQGLGAARGGRTLFSGLDLLVKRGDRLAILGPNGAGKSTLLKLLAGQHDPEDQGSVRLGANVDAAYFDQHLESLDPAASCIDEIRKVRPDLVIDACRQYLARFRFWGDDPFRAVASLSGGERTRVALAKMLLIPRNLLLLDEPTNHLDIPACEILEEALAHFDGTVLLVSHDRFFLERVATRVLHLDARGATLYSGAYADFARAHAPQTATTPAPATGVAEDRARKDRHEDRRRNAREIERRARRIADLERAIAEGETSLRTLRAQLQDAPGQDWERIAALADEEQSLSRKVDGWTEEWMRLSEEAQRS